MPTASLLIPVLSNSLYLNQSMAFHPILTLTNPQIARLCFRPIIPNTLSFSSTTATINFARRWSKEARTVCSVAGNHVVKANTQYNEDKDAWTALADNTTRVVKGSSEHSDNEKGFPTQSVRMEKKFPVKFKHTKSGKGVRRLALQSKVLGAGKSCGLP